MKNEILALMLPNKKGRWFSLVYTFLLVTFVTSMVVVPFSRAAVVAYTKTMFVEGLNNGGFVLITLRDPKNNFERRISALEASLLGAIHTQYHIDYDENGRKHAEEIAVTHWDKPFTFTNPLAFDNIRPSYTPDQLEQVRKRLSKYDKSALSKQLNDPYGNLHDVYTNPYRESFRDAVAQVLLENGILVGVDDRTPLLRPLEREDGDTH